MESSYPCGTGATSCSEALTAIGQKMPSGMSAEVESEQPWRQLVPQHVHQPLPHQLLNQITEEPRVGSFSMQSNSLHSSQQPAVQNLLVSSQEQRQVQEQPNAIDLRQLLGLQGQSYPSNESMNKMGQSWTPLPRSDISGEQRQVGLPQRVLPGVSSDDNNCNTGLLDDWFGQAYRELQLVREMHLSELTKLYRKTCEFCIQPPNPEKTTTYENTRSCIERMVKFLNMPERDIVSLTKDKFYNGLYRITCYVVAVSSKNSISSQLYGHLPQLQQWLNTKSQIQAANPVLASGSTGSSLLPVQEDRRSLQTNKTELNHNISLTGADLRHAPSKLQHGFLHPYTSNMPCQTNIVSPVCTGLSGPSPLGTSQQKNIFDTTIPPNPTTSPSIIKQKSRRPIRQTQGLKQPLDQSLPEEKKHQMLIQKMNEINEKQQSHDSPRFLLSSTPRSKATEKESCSLSSEYKNSKSLLSPPSRGSPLKSFAVVPEKPPLVASSFSVRDSSEQPPTPAMQRNNDPQILVGESSGRPQRYIGVTLSSIQNQLLALGTPEISASFSPTETTFSKWNVRTSNKELSPKSLFEMVELMSPKAKIAAVQDMISVITLIDTLSGEMVTSDSIVAICKDLAADTLRRSERKNFSVQCDSIVPNMMKRSIDTSVSYLSSSGSEDNSVEWVGCPTSGLELSARSRTKRQRTETPSFQLNDAVLEEIEQTNQSMIETVVNVVSGFDEDFGVGPRVGTVVQCSYSAVALDANLKQQNTSLKRSPIMLVQLFLPEDYPNSSPAVLNTSSVSCSGAGELEDLSEKAKMKFSLSLRKLSEPLSLREMARAWDHCARSVLSEYLQSIGGGSFSSTYGSWESCSSSA